MRLKLATAAVLLAVSLSPATAGMVYDRNGNFIGTTTLHGDGSFTGGNGERTVGRGNKAWTYNSSGQLVRYGIKRGNVLRVYDRNGRFTSSSVINESTATSTMYDSRGRLKGTANLR